jgi:hypothetical protein
VVLDLTSGAPVCQPAFTFSGNQYALRFSRTCLGAPGRFRARVAYRFDPPNDRRRTDFSPNGRYTPWVTFGAPA